VSSQTYGKRILILKGGRKKQRAKGKPAKTLNISVVGKDALFRLKKRSKKHPKTGVG